MALSTAMILSSNLNLSLSSASTPPLFGGYLGLGADEGRDKLR